MHRQKLKHSKSEKRDKNKKQIINKTKQSKTKDKTKSD